MANALVSVWRQRRRSSLAALGVTLGVGVLVAMVSVGQGAEREVVAQLASMGTDLVVVTAGQVVVIAGRARQACNVTTLKVKDATAMSTGLEHVLEAAPVQSQKLTVKRRALSAETLIVGTTPAYLTAKDAHVRTHRGKIRTTWS